MPRITAQLLQPLPLDVSKLAHQLSSRGNIKYEGPSYLFPTIETLTVIGESKRPIFLEFGKKTRAGFNEITSDYTKQEIVYLLSLLSPSPKNLIAVLNETCLEQAGNDFPLWVKTKHIARQQTSVTTPRTLGLSKHQALQQEDSKEATTLPSITSYVLGT